MTTLSDAINNAASQFGVDAGLLNTFHALEGDGTSSAGAQGPFQLMPKTALSLGVTDPFDPQQSANGAAQLIKQNYQWLSSKLGRAPTDWEQYLAYQQGPAGALALLKGNPGDSAVTSLMNAGLGTNYSLKAISGNGARADTSTGDFLSMIQGKVANASGGVSSGAPGASMASAAGSAAGGGGSTSSSGWSGWASHWIVRIMVFLLGLIFVGAGLVMFGLIRNPGAPDFSEVVPVQRRVARRAVAEV